ncbi:Transglutaminase-like superfamily-domain-containing protein [Emericellopsis atlantica]|uniref:Transglutaminase-like superfamily-domain-containing protein n=1 Tax=Emericellopsis atlantica TaxID=2614577 RepID=A0A9P7ZE87_9HYPO|nr:Transglutaminase-like superfamily-domain-containing protein [Emericellopsis atlantica]KAG9250177.1 Transglutaminase-like superfamily-domain-containing protein [Emericellopsis atlantica]
MTLNQLPDEVLQQVLHYGSPEDTLFNLRPLSRRFRLLTHEPLLWRHYCATSFRHWSEHHAFHRKLPQPASSVDWEALFVLRKKQNIQVTGWFEHILQTSQGRYERYGLIGALGYDAKDVLLEQYACEDEVDDHLARRYYAESLIRAIHRNIAIEQWRMLANPREPDPPLEKVFGAFDMFVLGAEYGDLDDISDMLDHHAHSFREAHPGLAGMTARSRALALVRWVRSENLVGMDDQLHNYRNLRNCLLGQALRHEEHESLPLISSVIYCCLARRIGLDAQSCNFPGHIFTVVSAAQGCSLNSPPHGAGGSDEEWQEHMYLDPFGADEEVSVEYLKSRLASMGETQGTDAYLAPMHVKPLLNRLGHNISATFRIATAHQSPQTPLISTLIRSNHLSNVSTCLYATMWSALIVTPSISWGELDFFLGQFASSWPEDVWLVRKYLRQGHHSRATTDGSWEILNEIDARDQAQPKPRSLRNHAERQVQGIYPRYHVGEVFTHRRYGYICVITGWSDLLSRRQAASERLGDRGHVGDINHIRFNDDHTYYTYIRLDSEDRHIIQEENIMLISNSAKLKGVDLQKAGKFFKRFDERACRFVSNVRELFPDD